VFPGSDKKAVLPPLYVGILTEIGQSVQRSDDAPMGRDYRDGQG
jgi:hypothetical protein